MKRQGTGKRMQGWALAAIGALGLVALSTEAATAGVAQLSRCLTITASGSYQLAKNLTAKGTCLVVQADSVTFDLNGFSIIGNGTGNGISDNGATHREITVRNGTIRNFDTGIALASSAMVRVENMTVSNNRNTGIAVGNFSIVTGNTAMFNNGDGILAGSYSVVTGNTAGQNGAREGHGIVVGGRSTVGDNTVNGNGGNGLQVNPASIATGDCGGSTVSGNTTTHNRGAGIRLSSIRNTVRNNTATANDAGGLVASCPSNVTGNTLTSNGGANMTLDDASGACDGSDNILQ